MKRLAWALGIVLASWPMAAQMQRTKVDINTETPEGQALQAIGLEADAAKKQALLEDFEAKYPMSANLPWVYGLLQPMYLKAEQWDKVFPVVDKLLAVDPTDADMAHGALKAAEAKKDPDLIMKWSGAAYDAAAKTIALPKPADADEAEALKARVDYAKQVQTYCEYALSSAATSTADPAKKIQLIEKLASMNPQSQYLVPLEGQRFLAYRQMNDNAKATEIADQLIAKNIADEDVLLFAADQYMQKKDYAKSLDASKKVVDLMKTKPTPAGVAAADWDKKKNSVIGIGLYLQGMNHSAQSQFVPADVALRESLPYLEGNDQLKASALFNLGLANYRLGDQKSGVDSKRILDALKFNQDCAAIKGPLQAQAQKNITVIRAQFKLK